MNAEDITVYLNLIPHINQTIITLETLHNISLMPVHNKTLYIIYTINLLKKEKNFSLLNEIYSNIHTFNPSLFECIINSIDSKMPLNISTVGKLLEFVGQIMKQGFKYESLLLLEILNKIDTTNMEVYVYLYDLFIEGLYYESALKCLITFQKYNYVFFLEDINDIEYLKHNSFKNEINFNKFFDDSVNLIENLREFDFENLINFSDVSIKADGINIERNKHNDDPRVTNINDSHITNINDPRVTNNNDSHVTNNNDSHVTNINDPRATNNNDNSLKTQHLVNINEDSPDIINERNFLKKISENQKNFIKFYNSNKGKIIRTDKYIQDFIKHDIKFEKDEDIIRILGYKYENLKIKVDNQIQNITKEYRKNVEVFALKPTENLKKLPITESKNIKTKNIIGKDYFSEDYHKFRVYLKNTVNPNGIDDFEGFEKRVEKYNEAIKIEEDKVSSLKKFLILHSKDILDDIEKLKVKGDLPKASTEGLKQTEKQDMTIDVPNLQNLNIQETLSKTEPGSWRNSPRTESSWRKREDIEKPVVEIKETPRASTGSWRIPSKADFSPKVEKSTEGRSWNNNTQRERQIKKASNSTTGDWRRKPKEEVLEKEPTYINQKSMVFSTNFNAEFKNQTKEQQISFEHKPKTSLFNTETNTQADHERDKNAKNISQRKKDFLKSKPNNDKPSSGSWRK
ncbi:hypothetical protein CDIK_1622 [Cucumispora dikerogammari]|nr:hypothetical protein CDIK_1622 [Cucumispora dikerogammari]